MSLELSKATSPSNSAFRVVCGKMVINGNQNLHHEAIFGKLISGDVSLEISGMVSPLNQNDIFFISPSNKYKLSGSADAVVNAVSLNFANSSAVTQDFIPQSIIRALVNGNCTHFTVISPEEDGYDTINNCMAIVTKAENEKGDFFQLQVYAKMYELFYELFVNGYVRIIDAETKSKKYRALMRVTNYVDGHYTEGVSLEEVANATGISRYYVSHLFKELMGTTFVGYVNELRLNRAAMLLVTTETPIIEIASLSGFNNLSNFNRAFKLHFGKTPSAYRKA
jgi:AraC-like DNA-binding protein